MTDEGLARKIHLILDITDVLCVSVKDGHAKSFWRS